jgi:hypothetical protein
MQMIYTIPFVFIFIIVAATVSMNQLSRWHTLVGASNSPPASSPFKISYFNHAIINGFQFNATMKIGIGDEGLYLQPIFPLSITMPAVLVPWHLLKPMHAAKNGLDLFRLDGTDVVVGVAAKWSSQILSKEMPDMRIR